MSDFFFFFSFIKFCDFTGNFSLKIQFEGATHLRSFLFPFHFSSVKKINRRDVVIDGQDFSQMVLRINLYKGNATEAIV